MHAVIQLLSYWLLAFLSLGLALLLLSIYFGMIGNDLELLGLGSELFIAGICSLIEGASFWAVVKFVPLASRALIVPVLIVGLIYTLVHYENWGRFDAGMLLIFQLVIGFFGVSLFSGHFQVALAILIGFGIVLAIFAGFTKGL